MVFLELIQGWLNAFFLIPYGIIDSNLAEVIAIRKALQLSSLKPEFLNVKITIESDSLNMVTWINQHNNSR